MPAAIAMTWRFPPGTIDRRRPPTGPRNGTASGSRYPLPGPPGGWSRPLGRSPAGHPALRFLPQRLLEFTSEESKRALHRIGGVLAEPAQAGLPHQLAQALQPLQIGPGG